MVIKFEKRDVRPTKLVDFEGIAKHHNVMRGAQEEKQGPSVQEVNLNTS